MKIRTRIRIAKAFRTFGSPLKLYKIIYIEEVKKMLVSAWSEEN
jgi:hypothetical protein